LALLQIEKNQGASNELDHAGSAVRVAAVAQGADSEESSVNRLMQDVQYALRQLRKAPGFTLTAVLTLALGIGANAAIFTFVHAVLLRNLPVADPKTLVRVGDMDDCCVNGGTPDENKYSLFAYDLYKHLRDNTAEFEQLAAMQAGLGYGVTARSSKPDALPKALRGELVSGNYFQTLGLRPYAGRLLASTDDVEGAPMAAVMSYQTWQRDYALDPSVVGSIFVLNSNPVTIQDLRYARRVASVGRTMPLQTEQRR
jgi:hypothetical protein